MTTRPERGKLLAFVLMVLLLLVSAGQALHVHGGGFAHTDPQVAALGGSQPEPSGEAGCPLCIAMHSASPAAVFSCEGELGTDRCEPSPIHNDELPATIWHFDLFGRPPPARGDS